jgi:CHAD domain-containing protein
MAVAYRLDLTVAVPVALRVVAVEQLEDAITQLRDGEDRVVAIHEARKDLKKVRSLLRLVRVGMDVDERRRANASLRAIAASLAGTRDADVMKETLAKLGASADLGDEEAPAPDVTGAIAALIAERDAVAQWPFDDVDHAALATGAAIAYARGRREYRASWEDATVEGLHEWRKRVKDLWYHARLLQDAWPGPLGALVDEAHALSDLLGDDHDLGVLAERVGHDEVDLYLRCHRRRAELQDEALALGAKVYVEKPRAFARRMATYLAG